MIIFLVQFHQAQFREIISYYNRKLNSTINIYICGKRERDAFNQYTNQQSNALNNIIYILYIIFLYIINLLYMLINHHTDDGDDGK